MVLSTPNNSGRKRDNKAQISSLDSAIRHGEYTGVMGLFLSFISRTARGELFGTVESRKVLETSGDAQTSD